jgi:hypothetical protein
MLRRDLGELTELLTVTLWESLAAVRAFAGDDYETAVFYPEDERFLVERDERCTYLSGGDRQRRDHRDPPWPQHTDDPRRHRTLDLEESPLARRRPHRNCSRREAALPPSAPAGRPSRSSDGHLRDARSQAKGAARR